MTTLSDADIESAMQKGKLVRNGASSQLAGACYELRLGSVYYDLTESDHPISLAPGESALIKPGHRVVLITHEELEVPCDMLARVVSKGSLFSVGLSPVATYADPGFSGNMGIVTQNVSDKYILLPQLVSIAKADFTRLSGTVVKPYAGQHGFRTQIWPIKHQLQKTYAEVRLDPRVKSEMEEGYQLLPQATANTLRGLKRRQQVIDIAIILALLFNASFVFLIEKNWIDNAEGVVGNLVASAICSIVAFAVGRRK